MLNKLKQTFCYYDFIKLLKIYKTFDRLFSWFFEVWINNIFKKVKENINTYYVVFSWKNVFVK